MEEQRFVDESVNFTRVTIKQYGNNNLKIKRRKRKEGNEI